MDPQFSTDCTTCVHTHRLTGFVIMSFGGARPFIFIDPVHITMAKTWLQGLQQPTGCITSVGKLFHNDMQVKERGGPVHYNPCMVAP